MVVKIMVPFMGTLGSLNVRGPQYTGNVNKGPYCLTGYHTIPVHIELRVPSEDWYCHGSIYAPSIL